MKITSCMGVEQAMGFIPPENSVLISIRDREEWKRPDRAEWDDILKLFFVDVAGNVAVIQGLKDHGYTVPTEKHGKAIAAFIRKHWDKNIYVHCEAGVSRSAAVVEVLKRLGWTVQHWAGDKATQFANPRVLKILLRQFPELLPVGAKD